MKRKLKPSLNARKLRSIRRDLKMTQEAFAKVMKCSPSTIAMKETGARRLTMEDEMILNLYLELKN